MASLKSVLADILPFRRPPTIDRYHVKVVTNEAELVVAEQLPLEIRYALAVRPSRFETFRQLLLHGYGIGVRIMDKTPERVLQAVDRISHRTQHNTVVPWLERLLRVEELPVFSREEIEHAEKEGVNLYEETKVILEQRFEFVKIVLVDLHNKGVGEESKQAMREINQDLYPLAIDTIVHRVTFDNAHTRTEVAQSIIKALIFIGPIAHALEHVLSGLGKIFAASADDILSEVAELFALRGSGFTWRQLWKRSWILVPVFALATYGAFQVEPLLHAGRIALAGVVFGFSAVALSLTTALQSIGMYRQAYLKLVHEGKLHLAAGQSLLGLALHQDFTNPARLGLFIGAGCSPLVAAIVFFFFPSITSNGWILAALGSTESIVASISVMSATFIRRRIFRANVRRALSSIVSHSRPRQGG